MTNFEKAPQYPQDPGSGAPPPAAYGGPVTDVVVPPGAELAGRGRRIGAFFLAIPLQIVTLFIGYWIWGLIVWGRGTTPALQVLGCRCVRRESGIQATWGTMALRNIVGRIVESIGPVGIVSFIIFLVVDDRRTLHDMIGGTIVVRDRS